jgi:hypothetical protein
MVQNLSEINNFRAKNIWQFGKYYHRPITTKVFKTKYRMGKNILHTFPIIFVACVPASLHTSIFPIPST